MELKNCIIKRINCILATPTMWGSPEAVESQIIQLIEILCRIEMPSYKVLETYHSYLMRKFPKQVRRPLFELIGKDDEKYSKLTDGLREFTHPFLWVAINN